MKASIDTIKIEMTVDEVTSLRKQLIEMISDIQGMEQSLGVYFDETVLREKFPKVNELLNELNVRDDLPF